MTDIEKRLLENQEVILLALNKLLTPHCKGSLYDANGETNTNNKLIDCYRMTKRILWKDYVENESGYLSAVDKH